MMSGHDALRECTSRGLALRADAMRLIENTLSSSGPEALITLVDAIMAHLDRRMIRVVDTKVVIAALGDLSCARSRTSIDLLDAWSMPRLIYDSTTKTS